MNMPELAPETPEGQGGLHRRDTAQIRGHRAATAR
jgi:hypothetical protein